MPPGQVHGADGRWRLENRGAPWNPSWSRARHSEVSEIWVARGTPIWAREAGLNRFEAPYQGTWRLEANAAELHAIGPAGQAAQTTRF